MATKVWGAGSGPQTTVYSLGANWTGDTKPGVGDDVVFNSTDVTNCTLDEATAAINSLTVEGTGGPTGDYSGTLDFNDWAVNVTGGGDAIFGGSGTVDCGTGEMLCSGNFNNKDQSTWIGTVILTMDGVSKTITSHTAKAVGGFACDGTIEVLAATISRFRVAGDLDIRAGATLTLSGEILFSGELTLTGDITGTNVLHGGSPIFTHDGGSIGADVGVLIRQIGTVSSGTWGGTWTCRSDSTNTTITFGNGEAIFEGSIDFVADNDTYTVDLNANNSSITLKSDISLTESGGTITFLAASTGIVKFDGTTTYTDGAGITQDLGDVEVSGALTLASDMDCDKFTGLNGGSIDMGSATHTLDASDNMDWQAGFTIVNGGGELAGATFHTSGIFTADGQDIGSATGTWELQAEGGSAVANGTLGSVKNCDARGDSAAEIQALGWTDAAPGGTNQNWNFGVVATTSPWNYYAQQAAIVG